MMSNTCNCDEATVFSNYLTSCHILNHLPTKEIVIMRSRKKIVNEAAIRILSNRPTAAKNFLEAFQVNQFLEVMKNRYEDIIIFNSYSFLLAEMNSKILTEFGQELGAQVKHLSLNLKENGLNSSNGGQAMPLFSSPLLKAFDLIKICSNLETLELTLGKDLDIQIGKTLAQEEKRIPPMSSLRTITFKVDLSGASKLFRYLLMLLQVRTPKCQMLELRLDSLNQANTTSILQFLIQKEFKPFLALNAQLYFVTNGGLFHPHHVTFIRSLVDKKYTNVTNVSIALLQPTDDLLHLANAFLDLECQALKYLKMAAATHNEDSTAAIIIPPLPNLVNLDIRLHKFPKSKIQPHPLTVENFPKLNNITESTGDGWIVAQGGGGLNFACHTRYVGSTERPLQELTIVI